LPRVAKLQKKRGSRQQRSERPAPVAPRLVLPPSRALALPGAAIGLLLSFTLFPSIRETRGLLLAFLGATAALTAWAIALYGGARRARRNFTVEIAPRAQHYMQACAQGAIFLYWGAYWREVYDFAYLIAAQLVFAYAFDALLAWSRRETWTLGFAPFPVIFSTNLFLWFKPEWFYLQFLMVALGFAAKELIRWNRDGRRVHIFNPSSFPLAVFSVVLLATGSSDLTWGEMIASTQLLPPQIYLLIFLVSLPGQFLFGVATMTLSAVATTHLFGLAYHAATGTYFFLEPSIPVAVFLGMHLLFTDPSTSPRSELGRIVFGVSYGLSVVALFAWLERLGVPSFYDKLLGVPVLNLLIQVIDRLAASPALGWLNPAALGRGWAPRQRHATYIAVWALVFGLIYASTSAEVTVARGDLLLTLGRIDEAAVRFREVVEVDANHAEAHRKLGVALSRSGRVPEALPVLRRAAELQPDDADAQMNLGAALLQVGRPDEAVTALVRARTARPEYVEVRYNLAHAYMTAGRNAEAVDELREILTLRRDWPPAMGMLAWLQATQADVSSVDPEELVRLAARAAELSGRRDPSILDALAASYAAAGRFTDATSTAEEAEALAARSAPQLAADIRARLDRYRAGQPIAAARHEIR
jgi:Flp pilus assembly protein TadD